jgi:hypothetical protein
MNLRDGGWERIRVWVGRKPGIGGRESGCGWEKNRVRVGRKPGKRHHGWERIRVAAWVGRKPGKSHQRGEGIRVLHPAVLCCGHSLPGFSPTPGPVHPVSFPPGDWGRFRNATTARPAQRTPALPVAVTAIAPAPADERFRTPASGRESGLQYRPVSSTARLPARLHISVSTHPYRGRPAGRGGCQPSVNAAADGDAPLPP